MNDILTMKEMFDEAEELYNKGDSANAFVLYTDCKNFFNKDGSGSGDSEIGFYNLIISMLSTIGNRCNSILEEQDIDIKISVAKHLSKTYTLTKTKYIKGLQCTKALWLDTYDKKEGIVTERKQVSFDAGKIFEARFKATFVGGLDLKIKLNKRISEYVPMTISLLQENEVVTIFEAGFIYEKTLVLIDVLQKLNGSITIFEVKNSKKLTNVILQDLSVQYYIVHAVLGDNLQSFNVVLNDGNDTFMIVDVTDVLKHNEEKVRENINDFNKIISDTQCPKIVIGEHCNYPYECEFQLFCKKSNKDEP